MQLFEIPAPDYLPMNNFSKGDYWGDNSENEFGNLFTTTYKKRFTQLHRGRTFDYLSIMKEVSVHGCGIADMVSINAKSPYDKNAQYILRSFEFKLHDWRKGIMQATRFKSFSDYSILVIPAEKLDVASNNIHLFKQLRIGLWGFDRQTRVIIPNFTPRPKKPQATNKVALLFQKAFEGQKVI